MCRAHMSNTVFFVNRVFTNLVQRASAVPHPSAVILSLQSSLSMNFVDSCVHCSHFMSGPFSH